MEDLVHYVHNLLVVRLDSLLLCCLQFNLVRCYENTWNLKKKFKSENLRMYLSSRSLIFSFAPSSFFNTSLSLRLLRKEIAHS